ncbi:MAG: hypothetical protein HYY61_05670 [Deltaproteobacteria bacterium]|nr:hypothetical protein [Deltaproteobacteria bacterium]
MKQTLFLTFLLVFLSVSFSVSLKGMAWGSKEKSEQQTPPDTSVQEKNYAAGEVLVKFKPKTPKRYILALKQELKVKEETYTESIDLYHWKGDFDTDSAIKKLQKSPHLLYAEPNYRVKIDPPLP